MPWSDQAAGFLLSPAVCPRCDRSPVGPPSCPHCGAVLTGPVVDELRTVSAEAASLLQRRQQLIDRLPVDPAYLAARTSPPAPAAAQVAAPIAPPGARPGRAGSHLTLQSVLAVAGAALFAIAAVVFLFFNDSVDPAARRILVALVTAAFLLFAGLLLRRELRFSAEAVGALGMALLALDIWGLSEIAPPGISPWVFAAVGTLVAALLMIALAIRLRLRVWLWSGLVGLILVPAFFGYSVAGPWSAAIGHLGAAAVAVGVHEAARRIGPRFASALRADRATATALQVAASSAALLNLSVVDLPDALGRVLGSSALIAALAVLAGLGSRNLAPRFWSAVAGVLGAVAIAVLPLALQLGDRDGPWYLALLPAAAAAALGLLALVPWPAALHRMPVRIGGLAVLLAVAVPAAFVTLWLVFVPLLDLADPRPPIDVFGPVDPGSGLQVLGVAAPLGVAAVSLGAILLALAARRGGQRALPCTALAVWLAGLALTAFSTWREFSRPGQLALALGVALVLGLALRRVRGLRPALRIPLGLTAHALVLVAVAVSWADDRVTVPAGAAIVAAVAVIALAMPSALRPGYVVAGYAYALAVFAYLLHLAGLTAIPVISYTATLAAVLALGATLVTRLRAPLWYAVLGVTAAPFAIGLATVVSQRTWETALANAAIFALSLVLALTRRPGLGRAVRRLAAALLVPTLAVVLVNVVPRIIETDVVPAWNGQGGAPVTLPIIATVIAIVLPSTPLIAGWLNRGGIGPAPARDVRLGIEISSLATAVVTVGLALGRSTAGLETALIVLLVLGIGLAATSVFARRGYGWWLAAASWTGALWCAWGIAGVREAEPYVFPPALAAVAVGTILTLRGRNGMPLVAPGLAISVATPLIVLSFSIGQPPGAVSWRGLGLLAASLALVVLGALFTRSPGKPARRLSALRVPVLAAAIGAAAGGAIQAVRYGLRADSLGVAPEQLIWPVLGLSALAALLAASAGALLRIGAQWRSRSPALPQRSRLSRTRLLLAPALVYLVVGPIAVMLAASRPEDAPTWVLWVLELLVLALLLVTVLRALRDSPQRRPTMLPPVWLTFAVAWCTAVAAWSSRELHVEWFSLPLGAALMGAGVLVLRRVLAGAPSAAESAPSAAAARPTLTTWPVLFRGSWSLLAPGLAVTLAPSVLATGTNPATWRAILVIALALVALLAASLFRLAAPFILSLVTFAVEIGTIFLVRAGREIDPLLLWIALATAGAVLLVIAVGFERRSGGDRSVGARLRDLR